MLITLKDLYLNTDWIFFYETVVLKGVKTQYINRVFSVFEKAGLSLQVNEKDIREAVLENTVPFLLRNELDKMKRKEYGVIGKIISRLRLIICKVKGEVSL